MINDYYFIYTSRIINKMRKKKKKEYMKRTKLLNGIFSFRNVDPEYF